MLPFGSPSSCDLGMTCHPSSSISIWHSKSWGDCTHSDLVILFECDLDLGLRECDLDLDLRECDLDLDLRECDLDGPAWVWPVKEKKCYHTQTCILQTHMEKITLALAPTSKASFPYFVIFMPLYTTYAFLPLSMSNDSFMMTTDLSQKFLFSPVGTCPNEQGITFVSTRTAPRLPRSPISRANQGTNFTTLFGRGVYRVEGLPTGARPPFTRRQGFDIGVQSTTEGTPWPLPPQDFFRNYSFTFSAILLKIQ